MKKSLLVVIILIGCLLLNSPIYATEVKPSASKVFDEELELVLRNQMCDSDQILLEDSEFGAEINNKPIIKIYNEIYWELSNESLDTILERADLAKTIDYLVFDEELIRLRKIQDGNEPIIGKNPRGSELNFIKDIQGMSTSVDILGTSCKVLNIYCFDMFTSHMGSSIYFVTDKGTFVKYYADQMSEGVWFTEQEYRNYASEYYDYLISPENNYNEKGEPVGGGLVPFLSYIDNYHNKTSDGLESSVIGYIIIIFVLTAIVIFGIIWFVIAKKKRILK